MRPRQLRAGWGPFEPRYHLSGAPHPGTFGRNESLHGAPRLSPLHRLWRLLPAERRRLFARATALIAPHPDRSAPPVSAGIAVVGEL